MESSLSTVKLTDSVYCYVGAETEKFLDCITLSASINSIRYVTLLSWPLGSIFTLNIVHVRILFPSPSEWKFTN